MLGEGKQNKRPKVVVSVLDSPINDGDTITKLFIIITMTYSTIWFPVQILHHSMSYIEYHLSLISN